MIAQQLMWGWWFGLWPTYITLQLYVCCRDVERWMRPHNLRCIESLSVYIPSINFRCYISKIDVGKLENQHFPQINPLWFCSSKRSNLHIWFSIKQHSLHRNSPSRMTIYKFYAPPSFLVGIHILRQFVFYNVFEDEGSHYLLCIYVETPNSASDSHSDTYFPPKVGNYALRHEQYTKYERIHSMSITLWK